MSEAASTASLNELHRKFAKQLSDTLDRDVKDEMPTDAATLSVIKSFLKDNNITCDPADADTTSELQKKFREQQDIREARKKAALVIVRDQDVANG